MRAAGLVVIPDELPASEVIVPGSAGFFLCTLCSGNFPSYLTVSYHADIGAASFLVITSFCQDPDTGKEVILMTGEPGIGKHRREV